MPARLTHLALHVPDLDACIAFYTDFCNLHIVHQRPGKGSRIVWMAEQDREQDFVLVMMPGGVARQLIDNDYSHFGFALDSRDAVDRIAERAAAAGCLLWPPREDEFPVGYYCGIRDPAGNALEFSYGQPLGPGARPLTAS